jgi:hypothetical protein
MVVFFYPKDSTLAARAPQLLDGLPTWARRVILANMRQSTSLTLKILKSLYPRANLGAAGEGFTVTCTEEEANKLVEDSIMTTSQIMEMLLVDMQLK